MSELGAPMTGDGIRAEPWTEAYREPLKAACAEDLEIWQIYATNFAPEAFDASFDKLMGLPWERFAIFADDGDLIGMSCYLNIDAPRPCRGFRNRSYGS